MVICGVRMSERRFWELVETVQVELRDAVQFEAKPITHEAVERKARRILERKLSTLSGKFVTLSDRMWRRWRDIFVPAWLIRELGK